MSDSLWPHGLYRTSPGQNTGIPEFQNTGILLQGIFPTQGLNPGLPRLRQILHQLSHKGSPRILVWVTCPFSSGSSRPRNQMGSHALQVDSLPAEPQGKPKNTGVGSLSLPSRYSQPMQLTGVSCIAGRFFPNWAFKEELEEMLQNVAKVALFLGLLAQIPWESCSFKVLYLALPWGLSQWDWWLCGRSFHTCLVGGLWDPHLSTSFLEEITFTTEAENVIFSIFQSLLQLRLGHCIINSLFGLL